MNCPNCGGPLFDLADDFFQCDGAAGANSCGLTGPIDVLEALIARLAPAGILAAAERLLRERGVHMVSLSRIEGVTLWGVGDRKIRSRGTLADAVARLEKEGGR